MLRRLFFLACGVTSVAGAQTAPIKKDIPAIARTANGSVVSIVMSNKQGKPIAQGSGFVVSKDGLIVTNYHVIAEGDSAVVKLPNGTLFVVDGVLAADKQRDLAIIKAHGENFRTVPLGNSDRVQIGEEVVAIGNPLSLESTVSNGIVSGIRSIKEEGGKYLQITAPISPGSSGGPVFNMLGEVIGITTMYLRGGENLNFAIPVNDAKRLLGKQSAKLQGLPNEPKPEISNGRAETEEAQQQQACHEQAAKFEHYNKPEADITAFVNSFSMDYQRCFIEIGSYQIVKRQMVAARDGMTWKNESREISPYPAWQIKIYDASSEGDKVPVYGWLTLTYRQERQINCYIFPTGMPYREGPSDVNNIGCRSKEEFDELASKHFGLAPVEGIRFPDSNTKIAASVPDFEHGTWGQYVEDATYCYRNPHNFLQSSGSETLTSCNQFNANNEKQISACKTDPQSQTKQCKKILMYFEEISEGHLPAKVKISANSGNDVPTPEQFWDDAKYCFQNPTSYLKASNGEIIGCDEVSAAVEAALKADCEGKARKTHPGCEASLERIRNFKEGRP